MDSLALALLILNALALSLVAIWNYRSLGTLELMKGFSNYFLTYILVWLLIFMLALVLPASAKAGGGLDGLARGNFSLSVSGSLCLPAAIPLLIIFAYAFTKIPGNGGRLSYALFAFMLAQQLLYAFESAAPQKAMMWLGLLYAAGFFAILFAGAPLAGKVLARAFPDAKRRHEEWVRAALSDPDFGAGDATARMIKMNLQAGAPPAAAGPNETQIKYNPRQRPLFSWQPSDAAAALVLFSIWNLVMYMLPVMF